MKKIKRSASKAKKFNNPTWASFLQEEISKDNVCPDDAITCSEFVRQSGLSRTRATLLLSRLVKDGRIKEVVGRTLDKKGRSIKTTCYVLNG